MHQYAQLREQLLTEARKKLRESVDEDTLIIQAVTTLELLDKNANALARKGKEWFGYLDPSLTAENKVYLELALERQTGFPDEKIVKEYLKNIHALYEQRDALLAYLEQMMERHCPDVNALAGTTLGAKLLSHAGSLRKLASVPSSTVQLYGAETALFRHLRNKRRRSPKYGLIFNHPLVQKSKEQGKAARALADKLSICARIDYFKGEQKAAELRQQLEKRFGPW